MKAVYGPLLLAEMGGSVLLIYDLKSWINLGLYHVKNFVDLFDSILWGDTILHHHKAISCVANELADRHTQIERQLFKLVNGGDTTTLDVGDKAGADAALLAGGGGADPPLCTELFDILHKKIDIQGRSLLY